MVGNPGGVLADDRLTHLCGCTGGGEHGKDQKSRSRFHSSFQWSHLANPFCVISVTAQTYLQISLTQRSKSKGHDCGHENV
jgi:hypothetical protein